MSEAMKQEILNLQNELKESKNREKELNRVILGLTSTIERLSNRPTQQRDFVSKVEEQVNRLLQTADIDNVTFRQSREKSIRDKQNMAHNYRSQKPLLEKPQIKGMISNLLKVKTNLMNSTDR